MNLFQMRDLVQAAIICIEAIPEGVYVPIDQYLADAYNELDTAFADLEEQISFLENLEAEFAADNVAGDRSSA